MTSSSIHVRAGAFGVTAAGEPVECWTLSDGELTLAVLDLGGIIQRLIVPGAGGAPADVVLGFDSVAGYEQTRSFAGGIIGRYANRLAGSRFSIDGTEHQVEPNEGPNAVHGGPVGFHQRRWQVSALDDGLRLALTSSDGDQGFPGRLEVVVHYRLRPGGRLDIDYQARTDAPTVVSLTQHSYFNLAGVAGRPDLDGHTLQVRAGHYLPVDRAGLPSGEIAHVVGTPFDLRHPQPLDLLCLDHTFVLDDDQTEDDAGLPGHGHGHGHGSGHDPDEDAAGSPVAAVLEHADAGRRLRILTSEPGLQVYTGSGLDGSDLGKGGVPYGRGAAVALEAQAFPDAPNQPAFGSPDFASTVLRPGQVYRSRTSWIFDRP